MRETEGLPEKNKYTGQDNKQDVKPGRSICSSPEKFIENYKSC